MDRRLRYFLIDHFFFVCGLDCCITTFNHIYSPLRTGYKAVSTGEGKDGESTTSGSNAAAAGGGSGGGADSSTGAGDRAMVGYNPARQLENAQEVRAVVYVCVYVCVLA